MTDDNRECWSCGASNTISGDKSSSRVNPSGMFHYDGFSAAFVVDLLGLGVGLVMRVGASAGTGAGAPNAISIALISTATCSAFSACSWACCRSHLPIRAMLSVLSSVDL